MAKSGKTKKRQLDRKTPRRARQNTLKGLGTFIFLLVGLIVTVVAALRSTELRQRAATCND
ncbi:MAG: hypothetical protein ACOY0S_04175 [Patescibacteria group bacterium]